MDNNQIELVLSQDEALVLFEFLSRFSDTERLSIEHQAEERALYNLTCVLEKVLSEPFQKNYQQLLQQARQRLVDSTE